jgi:hypothetical protein
MLSDINEAWSYYLLTAGTVCLAGLSRMFQYFDFQARLRTIKTTFKSAFGDLFHLFLVLVLVALTYAFAGFLLFGPKLVGFSEYNSAVVRVFEMIFSIYKIKQYETHMTGKMTAELYEMLFKVFVILLLLKMLVAIIFVTYKKIMRASLKKESTVFTDVEALLQHGFDWLWSFAGDGYVPPSTLRAFCRALEDGEAINGDDGLMEAWESARRSKKIPTSALPELSTNQASWVMNRYGKKPFNWKEGWEIGKREKLVLEKEFDSVDQDGSGAITKSELAKLLKRDPKHEQDSFCGCFQGAGKDDECQSNKTAAFIFKKADKDNSGTIQKQEFIDFIVENTKTVMKVEKKQVIRQ